MPFDCFGISLCRAIEPCTCVQSNPFGALLKNPLQAEDWLRKLTRNSMSMSGLRQVAAKCGAGSVNQMDNGAVIKLIAQQISAGQLRICSPRVAGATTGDPGANAAAVDSKPFPLTEAKKRPQSSAETPPADPNTFSDDLDSQAQAAALSSAASNGQPFCPE